VKIPQPKETEEVEGETPQNKTEFEKPLPQTLVRIPTEHAPMLQQSSTGGGDNED
jgi:DASH complex subunit DAD2